MQGGMGIDLLLLRSTEGRTWSQLTMARSLERKNPATSRATVYSFLARGLASMEDSRSLLLVGLRLAGIGNVQLQSTTRGVHGGRQGSERSLS